MKHVAGRTLDEVLHGTPLPVEQAREILCLAADALGHAHRRGIVHRDVKPSNIMLDEQGRVLLMDFGISKALESGTQYTSTGQMIGTPRYMSPEQALGGTLDGRSDEYSLGIVGYEMLVGSLPFSGDSVHVLMYKHVHETPASVRASARTCPPRCPTPCSGRWPRSPSSASRRWRSSRPRSPSRVAPERRAAGAGREGRPTVRSGPVEVSRPPDGKVRGRRSRR